MLILLYTQISTDYDDIYRMFMNIFVKQFNHFA